MNDKTVYCKRKCKNTLCYKNAKFVDLRDQPNQWNEYVDCKDYKEPGGVKNDREKM